MSHRLYPKKETPLDYPIDPLIEKRWSPVAFSSEPIEPEKIHSLFEAMRWAPSSGNGQPWRVIYATQDEQENFDRLASLLDEGNGYAKRTYLLLLTCALPRFEDKDRENPYWQHDTGLGTQNLILQAVAMNLIAHPMAGFNKERAHELLGIPVDVEPMVMIAVGYPGDGEALTDERWVKKQQQPRQRKPVTDFAFRGKWNSKVKSQI
ncbi:MAG: hypothetical protein A2951_02530 [Candidatus Buchananbacteria bacterium RIFCSPLOWO2_01_FULL_56_15]|uniref:Nitroreductase domain-containing protein n=1 Tax=Candidatus Buchananbacteria bacterium RIFCSPLOWO2_01_FULL_56_15 TaxID=1797547 RepID=A0A1G1YT53_9BACT|nr:MAG: hypothetical protein A2951_02530 [Candidatus Buchananbacteria bacterium RIFCSPLOWO2_01_FULL_56_15]